MISPGNKLREQQFKFRLDFTPQYSKKKKKNKNQKRPQLKMFNIRGDEHKQSIIKFKSYLRQN
jgi:hypothetical protein